MNKQEAQTFFTEAMETMKKEGFTFHRGIKPQLKFNRATRTIGYMHWQKGQKDEITITEHLLNGCTDEATKNTIVHELCHSACPTSEHHGKAWKEAAQKASQIFGTEIKRCGGGLTEEDHEYLAGQRKPRKDKTKYEYTLTCQSCGYEWIHYRKCRSVQHPEDYTCHCGGELKLTKRRIKWIN